MSSRPKSGRKLAVRRETIQTLAPLSDVDLAQVVGGRRQRSSDCLDDPQSGNSRLC